MRPNQAPLAQTSQQPAPYLLPVLLVSSAFTFLNFGLPVYVRELGASATTIGGMFTVFTVTMLVVRPLVGLFGVR